MLNQQNSDKNEVLQQKQKIAEQEKKAPVPSVTAHSMPSRQHSNITLKLDRVERLEQALQSQSEEDIAFAVDTLDDCPDCMERIADFLSDSLQAEDTKIALAKALMKTETRERTLLLVNAIVNAHQVEQVTLKEHLLQVLADVYTLESVNALLAIITGEVPGQDFHQMPEDVRTAIQKAIRLNPDLETTGRLLADHYNSQLTPEIAEDIYQIQHPMMISLLAKEAYEGGDIAEAEQFTNIFPTMNNLRTLEGLMFLSRENVVPIDDANWLAYEWVGSHSEQFDSHHYEAYLSEFDADVVQRSVAAFALAASPDQNSAYAALEKAHSYENDPYVLNSIESAMNLISDNSSDE